MSRQRTLIKIPAKLVKDTWRPDIDDKKNVVTSPTEGLPYWIIDIQNSKNKDKATNDEKLGDTRTLMAEADWSKDPTSIELGT